MTAPSAVLPLSFSPWQMFLAAGPVVRCVMMLLLLASLLSWIVLVAKSIELSRMRRRLKEAETSLERAESSEEGGRWSPDGGGIAYAMILAAEEEWRHSAELLDDDSEGVKERVMLRLERLEAAEGRRLGRGTGLLATIGATAPFVGLFGTVWGIMSSFTGIAAAHATSLAVVAPGIAEALLATALGLLAAIPAVVIYNHLVRAMASCRSGVADLSALVMRRLSRDLARVALSRRGAVVSFAQHHRQGSGVIAS